MTFSILARCPATRMLGIATATRSFAVGARVPFAEARCGVVAIMSRADARLGRYALGLPEKLGTLFNMAVVKANNPEAMADTRTLIRAAHGGLADATSRDQTSTEEAKENAWILCAPLSGR